jgi:hypothetical protein
MMTEGEFVKQEFITLRAEIQASKSRAFWILVVSTLLVITAAHLAAVEPKIFANAVIPLIFIVLILAFAMEQNAIIRAGRYIREHIEPGSNSVVGWESWLETNRAFREVDRFFFGGFILIFLAFFVVSCTLSLNQLHNLPSTTVFWCAATVYGLGLLCVVIVLIRHWHSCTTTSNGEVKK